MGPLTPSELYWSVLKSTSLPNTLSLHILFHSSHYSLSNGIGKSLHFEDLTELFPITSNI